MKVTQGEVFRFVAMVAAEQCSTAQRPISQSDIRFESNLVTDFNVDSIQLYMIVDEVEQRFQVDFDYLDINELTTIRSLVELVMSIIAAKQPTLV